MSDIVRVSMPTYGSKRPRAIDLLSDVERRLRNEAKSVRTHGGCLTKAMRAAEAAYIRALRQVNEAYRRRHSADCARIHTAKMRDPAFRARHNTLARIRDKKRYRADAPYRLRKIQAAGRYYAERKDDPAFIARKGAIREASARRCGRSLQQRPHEKRKPR